MEPLYEYEDYNGSLLGEGIMNQYYILLGDFGNMVFERSSEGTNSGEAGWIFVENKLVTFYFLGSTFVT